MGRLLKSQDGDDLARVIHERNVICSQKLLESLKAFHPELEPEKVRQPIVEEPPLPPIPNAAISEAARIAFPKYLSRIEAIQRATLAEFPNMTLFELKSQRRTAKIVQARQLAMYLAKKLTTQSLPEIGRRFGGRDHTTVLHAVRKIEKLVTENSPLAAIAERISERVPEAP